MTEPRPIPAATLCLWRAGAQARIDIMSHYAANGEQHPPVPASELLATTEALILLLDEIERLKAAFVPRPFPFPGVGGGGAFVVHPDLLHFDLRRPYREWPESVRTLIEQRQRETPP